MTSPSWPTRYIFFCLLEMFTPKLTYQKHEYNNYTHIQIQPDVNVC